MSAEDAAMRSPDGDGRPLVSIVAPAGSLSTLDVELAEPGQVADG